MNEFLRIWREQYLTSLRERTQTSLKAGRFMSPAVPKCGDIVLIKDNVHRGSWKIAKVIELNDCKEKDIQSARVKLPSKKMLNRPLSLLYPLECSSGELEIHSKNLQPPVPNGTNIPYRGAKEVAQLKTKYNHAKSPYSFYFACKAVSE